MNIVTPPQNNDRMSEDEIINRLRLNNPKLISQILFHSYKFYDEIINERKNLDKKANWLLAMSAFLMTSMFFTIIHILPEKEQSNIIPLYGLSLFCILSLFVAIIYLFRGVKVRNDFKGISENDIIDKRALEETDKEKESTSYYDRFFITYLIKIAIINDEINRKKGFQIKFGQIYLILGLVLFILCQLLYHTFL